LRHPGQYGIILDDDQNLELGSDNRRASPLLTEARQGGGRQSFEADTMDVRTTQGASVHRRSNFDD
jgi:hypothetical protein